MHSWELQQRPALYIGKALIVSNQRIVPHPSWKNRLHKFVGFGPRNVINYIRFQSGE
jgi:hypothetical protein